MSTGTGGAAPLEREVKLAAGADVEVPPLDGVLPGLRAVAAAPEVLDARYWDTADLRLIRSGVSLRHRTRDGAAGTWTVKVPAGGGVPTSGALVRTEVDLPGPGGRPPAQAVRLVAAHARDAELVPMARLVTTRTTLALEIDGRPVGELADDLVEVFESDEVVVRFREVEIEVGATVSEPSLGVLVAALRAAGAGAPDPTPKVARALGPRALAPPDLRRRDLGSEPSAGDALAAALADAAARIVAAHHVAVASGDPDAVRSIRVAARRARNLLRVAAPLVDDEWSTGLRAELRWLVDQLGDVRRLDARSRRVRSAARHLVRDDDRVHAEQLTAILSELRSAAWAEAAVALGSPRYRSALEQLVSATAALPATGRAGRPAAAEGRRLVRPQWRRLHHAVGLVDAAGADPLGADAALGAVRTLARRVRVGADLVAAVDDRAPARLASALADVGDALGLRADALETAAWLRAIAGDVTRAEAMVAGQLLVHELRTADRADARWRRAWDRADHRKASGWIG